MRPEILDAEHQAFADVVRRVIRDVVAGNYERWEQQEHVDRDFWSLIGKAGLLGLGVPEEFGGTGEPDFRLNAIVDEEFARAGYLGLSSIVSLQNDIIVPYMTLATSEQAARWLPGLSSGELVFAVAMTEAEAGSDLRAIRATARRDGAGWVLTGTKLFITNGVHADRIITLARTDGERGFGLFVVSSDQPGFRRGQHLSKIGLRAGDAAELIFDGVYVSDDDVLGDPYRGLSAIMSRLPQERVSIAVTATAAAEAALALTVAHGKTRKTFGRSLLDHQHVRFGLARLQAEVELARTYIDRCVLALNAGSLSAGEAAVAKLTSTELQGRVADFGLQLHGGSGYMSESPIARAWLDARVQRIYGGANEIMCEVIARSFLDSPATSRQAS